MADSILTIIPARGGSKALPRKNIRQFGDKPLIKWTIDAAEAAGLAPIVSTDDEEIARISKDCGAAVPFMRPAALAGDKTPMITVVLHALEQLEGDAVCLLQPTSPFRTSGDIQKAIALFEETRRPVVAVTHLGKPRSWLFQIDESCALTPCFDQAPATSRQHDNGLLVPNGAIYIISAEQLRRDQRFITADAVGYVMPASRSIDIDDELDWELATVRLKRRTDG